MRQRAPGRVAHAIECCAVEAQSPDFPAQELVALSSGRVVAALPLDITSAALLCATVLLEDGTVHFLDKPCAIRERSWQGSAVIARLQGVRSQRKCVCVRMEVLELLGLRFIAAHGRACYN